MDQAITDVNAVKNGYNITVENLEKMPMPIALGIKTKNGKTEIIKVPVDVWMKNKSWVVFYPTSEEVVEVVLDPQQVFPDSNADNNKWTKN